MSNCFFNKYDRISINLDTVKKYASNKYIDTIYMIPDDGAGPGGGFSGLSTKNITKLRDLLQQRIDVSPKVRGKGDFEFVVGSALPADSLWFVQQGWTVNKYLENQR